MTNERGPAKFYPTPHAFYQQASDRILANQLNIKSEDGYRLATELAALTGESLTSVVTEALRERLDREHRSRDRLTRLNRLASLASEIRASLRVQNAAASLYDGNGMPR